jgi:hypothetical protein
MSDESKVMSMLGCTEEEARTYLDKAEGDVLKAIEENLNIPVVSGEKYIPAPRVIDDGLDADVREKLNEARKLSDLFNASIRNDLLVSPVKTSSAEAAAEVPAVEVPVAEQPAVEEAPVAEQPAA